MMVFQHVYKPVGTPPHKRELPNDSNTWHLLQYTVLHKLTLKKRLYALFSRYIERILIELAVKKLIENGQVLPVFLEVKEWPSFAGVLGGESKVRNGAKPCITRNYIIRNGRMSFCCISPKGLSSLCLILNPSN